MTLPFSHWLRPGLHLPQPCDTILLDIDGVLISSRPSFRETVIAVTEYVVGTLHGLSWGQEQGQTLVTQHDIEGFKQAGGFNDDETLSYALASLCTARWREWQGTLLATRSLWEWATMAREATVQGWGGRAWVEIVVPTSARPADSVIRDLYQEYYWGADELQKHFRCSPRYLPKASGLMHQEALLLAPDLPEQLRTCNIRHLGLITGRIGPEVDSALERLAEHCGGVWWEVVISANVCPKPDPQALRLAIAQVGTQGGLYLGDTADDHDLVRHYQASKTPAEPEMLCAMCVTSWQQARLYRERGAAILLSSVNELLPLLDRRAG